MSPRRHRGDARVREAAAGGRGGRRRGDGGGAASSRWCRGRVHVVLRPARSSSRRPGSTTSRRTSSPAGSRRARRCSRRAPTSPACRRRRWGGRLAALGALGFSMAAWCTTSGAPRASSTCCGSSSSPHRCRSAPGSCRSTARSRAPAAAPSWSGCCPPQARRAAAAGALVVDRPAGLLAGRRAAGRGLHRGTARRHRDALVALGLPRAALRLRRLRRRRVGGLGMVAAPRQAGPARGDGRRRRGRRAARREADGALHGDHRRAAAQGPGREA